jgi:molybdenum cofactor cytidylyltransferase
VDWALESAMAADLHPAVLAVGYRARAVTRAAPSGVLIARTRRWRWGASYSLNAALELLEPWSEVEGVCIGLADQPLVGSDAYRRLDAAAAAGATLAVATYDGVRANPVLVARSLWGEARRLRGDVGARALMERHRAVEVDCTGTGDPTDVDTLDDLRALEDRLS